MPRATESTREGGREEPKAPSPELSDPASPLERNSSGNNSPANQLLNLREHIIVIYKVLDELAAAGIIDTQKQSYWDMRRAQQKGFRRGR